MKQISVPTGGGFLKKAADYGKEHMMYIVLIVLVIFFTNMSDRFLSLSNMRNILNQSSYLIIVGVGIALVMLSGGIDLSVGYQMSLIGVVMGKLMYETDTPILLIILLGLAMGCAMSLINGILFVKLKVFPFIITLATQYVFMGLSFMVSSSQTYINFPTSFRFLGQGFLGPIPVAIILMALVVAFGSFVLNKSYFGRYIYGLGSNPEAVSLSGVNVSKTRMIIYGIAGLFTALGTIVLIARSGSSASTMGPGTEFTLIAGAMLGGIRMGGGGGKISSIVVGVLILTIIQNGMQMMQMDVYPQYVVKGIVLTIAIGLDSYQSMKIIRQAKQVKGDPPSGSGNVEGQPVKS